MPKIGIGVVGLGRIGQLHAEIFNSKIPNAKLVAVSDVVENLVKSASEKFNVKGYLSYEEMLRDTEVDAVVICTPTFLHKDMIMLAAEYHKHILCEKPLTVTVKEAEEVLSKISNSNVILQVGYMRRFDYAYQEAKKKINAGDIGRPVAFIGIARDPAPPPGWAADPKLSGGIFLDMLSHDFDMARWLMDSEIKRVYVEGGAFIYEEIKEKGDLDVVTINFRFENGAVGFIHGSRKSAFGYDLRTEVLGTEGTVYIGYRQDPMFAIGVKQGLIYSGIKWFFKRFYDAYVEEDKHFIDCLINDKKPLITGEDGKKAVEIAEASWKSLKENKAINLP
ncbi:MAG: Gfo/Idh/MocA family oxidoreductase [Thermoproteales archaeon]|nr:Gfo/Idh/MocA family oxidoreductase [Thermoproteales archaeon]